MITVPWRSRGVIQWCWRAATALSLFLCVVAASILAASYWYHTEITLESKDLAQSKGITKGIRTRYLVVVRCGGIRCSYSRFETFPLEDAAIEELRALGRPSTRLVSRLFERFLTRQYPALGRAPVSVWNDLGFYYLVTPYQAPNGTLTNHHIVLPLWFLVGVFLILPAVQGWRMQRVRRGRRRDGRGLCVECGYDLRAHHPGQKCPECGTEVPAGSGAAAGKAGTG